VRQSEQRFDQNTGANHLGNQVEDRYDQRADGGRKLDALAVEFGVKGVGERVFSQALHGFGHHKECHHPTGQITDGIQEPIVTDGGDHAADSQERGSGKIVTGKGDTVDGPVNLATSGKVIRSRLGAAGEVK